MTGDSAGGPEGGAEVTTPEDRSQDAGIRTFLIADVRGYTKYTQEHGDQAAATLAGAFAELVREVVEVHEGFLLELRGDEALVVFASARRALRAAVELQERFGKSGLARGVGIGLDSGEAVPVGDGYRGGALNLAARLCAQAKSGQILASESVIHLAAKVDGVAYVDPRTFRLKGYAEPVRVVEVVPSERAGRYNRRHRLGRRTRQVLGRPKFRAVVAASVVVGLLAFLLPRVLSNKTASDLAGDPKGMAILDVKTGKQLGFIPTSVVSQPAEAIYSEGHFWVLNLDPLSFVEIDAKTGKVLQHLASPVADIGFYGVHGNDLWITNYTQPELVRVDIRRRRAVSRFILSDDPGYPAGGGGLFAEGSVWVGGAELLRIDPSTGRIQHRFPEAVVSGAIAYADGSIWTTGGPSAHGVLRVDPQTNTVVATLELPTNPIYIAAGGGFGWVTDEVKGVVYKIDPQGTLVATYSTGEGARVVSYADGTLWVGNQDAGTATGIDAVTGEMTTYRFEHPLQAVAAGAGSLLVQLNPGRTYEDRIGSLQGNVARLLVGGYQYDHPDPANLNWTILAFEVTYATCAKLLNYPDKPAPEGWRLQPEVAASMPDISADGRTYTFTIQPGYRFSPPSNQPVTAETFRFSIERALAPQMEEATGPRASAYVRDIEGEQAFRDGKAEGISGLRARGDQLSITLTHPSSDFLDRLAIPFLCPVPTDTPAVPDGAVIQSTSDPTGAGSTIPSAGPYYVADMANGEYIILKRNPNYTGPRPHTLDAIALREGVDPGQAVNRVQQGTWDGITNLVDPVMNPGGQVAKNWGADGTASTPGPRYYAVPDGGQNYLVFNANRPLFSDRRVRQAVAYALNRPAMAQIFGAAIPSDQILPPGKPLAPEAGLFPVDGPDVEKAKALMAGRHATAVLLTNHFSVNEQVAEQVKVDLAPIGIAVRIKVVEDAYGPIFEPGAPYDLSLQRTGGGDSIDSINYLQWLLDAESSATAIGSLMPSGWQSPVVRLATKRLRAGPTEAEALALLQGPIAREVPLTGLFSTVAGALFAPRVGCRVFPPASYGVDLAALCLAQ